MIVKHNPQRTSEVLDQMRASFGMNVREGIHLSDLSSPRRSYWARVLPMLPTDDEVLYWTAGRGHEDALGRVAGLTVTDQKFWLPPHHDAVLDEYGVMVVPISYRPDFTWHQVPAEFKTRRSNLAVEGEETVVYDTYLDQLLGYCAIEDLTRAVLIVFSLLEGRSSDPLKPTKPELRVYDVEFTKQELANKRIELMTRRNAFEAELVAHSMEQLAAAAGGRLAGIVPSKQDLCKAWMCGKPVKIVDRAAHCVECNKDLQEPWASKHASTRTGSGHTVLPEVARWEYQARCKWYGFCRPQDTDSTRGAR